MQEKKSYFFQKVIKYNKVKFVKLKIDESTKAIYLSFGILNGSVIHTTIFDSNSKEKTNSIIKNLIKNNYIERGLKDEKISK